MEKRGGTQVDGFGTFLEAMTKRQADQGPTGDPGRRILCALAETGSQPVTQLQASIGMGFTEFSNALTSMSEAGLLTVAGPPGQERAALTKAGEYAAQDRAGA